MGISLPYRIFQRTHANIKLTPILKTGAIEKAVRVLDLGCGPGTNFSYFQGKTYLGLDLNKHYIEYAQSCYDGSFKVEDITLHPSLNEAPFDFILINSVLHHLTDDEVNKTITFAKDNLSLDGRIHILEPLTPESGFVARMLAKLDRGSYFRTELEWSSLICPLLTDISTDRVTVPFFGFRGWHMAYWSGR